MHTLAICSESAGCNVYRPLYWVHDFLAWLKHNEGVPGSLYCLELLTKAPVCIVSILTFDTNVFTCKEHLNTLGSNYSQESTSLRVVTGDHMYLGLRVNIIIIIKQRILCPVYNEPDR